MTDLNFSQSERRNPLPTILIAAAVLAAIAAAVFYFNPHDTAVLSLSNTSVVPTRTNFKNESTVIEATPAGQDDLYILTTLRIEDHLRSPITINTITATLITPNDEQTVTTAANQQDLPAIFGSFPQLKPLKAAPLPRETVIQPGQSASGQIILHFPIPKSTWDTRKSAIVTVDLYNQNPQTIKIP